MAATMEIEIGLWRKDAESWTVEFRASQRDELDEDVRCSGTAPAVDVDDLRDQLADDAAYGKSLTESLFSSPEISSAFREARAVAAAKELDVRMRLFISPSSPELQALRWETLLDPSDHSRLTTNEHLAFSRYLSSLDWRPVAVRPKRQLRALIVVANPSDIESGWGYAAVDPMQQVELATQALQPAFETTALVSNGRATRGELLEALRDGSYDLVYIACHGRLHKGQPELFLERGDGRAQRVSGGVLVEDLRQVRALPRLIVFASCQSGGTGDGLPTVGGGALTALGPMLAAAGIPAVVAMQGNISITTASAFMPAFFHELSKDGRIDRAMAVARSSVKDRADWWLPVLFMRLKSGRLWYRPGLGRQGKDFDKWEGVVGAINEQACTPILGPGLTDSLIGTRQELAWRWADKWRFPMAPQAREDLPQVAQFLAARFGAGFPRRQLRETILDELRDRHRDQMRPDLLSLNLDDLLEKLAQVKRASDPHDPHRVLAKLPFRIYLTTHPTDLLVNSLREAGKRPVFQCFEWNKEGEYLLPDTGQADKGHEPTVDEPFVFHLFGHLSKPRQLVLTEDDFFNYLISWNSRADRMPPFIEGALASTSLLFLGFRLDQWDFRVLFRSIMSLEGILRKRDYPHVGVQVNLDESHTLDADAARRYLDDYFRGEINVNLYWGSVDDFVKQLDEEWERR